jgi:queuine tRNA-ribosyltransferase
LPPLRVTSPSPWLTLADRVGHGALLTPRETLDSAAVTLGFEVSAREGAARRGRLLTAHGVVETPVFMPVGTAATVKAMTAEGVAATGARLVLGNTYHLMLRPGAERIAALGGLHLFMNWPHAILTDSGGFQVMSLAKLRKIGEDGVTFRSHLDGSAHLLTPERSIAIQRLLGADITMALDECTPYPSPPEAVEASMELSMRWAERSRSTFVERPGHGIFGIVQGGVYPDIRQHSAARLVEIGFDGYAVGGLAIGEGQATTFAVLDATVPALSGDRPHYLMGVGKPADLVGAVMRGIDMFDCVLPTRSGRTAQAFTRRGTLNLRNARHAGDPAPLDPECRCPACAGYSRAYLHHLCRSREILGAMLLTAHNLHYYADLMADIRGAIENGALADFAAAFAEAQTPSPPETRE